MSLQLTIACGDYDRTHPLIDGSIKPEAGGDNLPFERSAFKWDIKANPPKTGQRLSYEVGTKDNKPCALNLETI